MKKHLLLYLANLLVIGQNIYPMNYGFYDHSPSAYESEEETEVKRAVKKALEEAELKKALKAIEELEAREQAKKADEQELEDALQQIRLREKIEDERELNEALQAIQEYEAREQAQKAVTNALKNQSPQEEAKQCKICFTDGTEFSSLSCKHSYCQSCLEKMSNVAAKESSTKTLKCPECLLSLGTDDIDTLTKDEKTRAVLYAILQREARRAIALIPGIKECPTPDCNYVFSNEKNTTQNFQCPECNHIYCSNCLISHDPWMSSCESEKRSRDQAVENWKKAHTKPCPVCGVPCEREKGVDVEWYGCNHMTCSNNHDFCWDCLRLTDKACDCILNKSYGHVPLDY